MNTATIISIGNIEKVDAVIRGIAALTMIGIVLTFDLDTAVNSVLTFLSIPMVLLALLRWNSLQQSRELIARGNFLRA